MIEDLEITKSEYIDILRNREKQVSSEIDDVALLKKVKYLKKRDLVNLATIRGLVLDESSLQRILDVLFKDVHKKKHTKLIDDIHKHYHKKKQNKVIADLHKYHHKQKSKNIKEELYRNLQKRKNIQIIKDLKRLKRLKNSNLAKKENISQKELDEVKRLSDLPTKILRKLVQLRNADSTGLKRSELLYILMKTQKHKKETEYLNHLQAEAISDMKSMIIKIKKIITELGMLLSKSERNNIRERLNEIDRERPNTRQEKRLLHELTKIFNDLKFEKEYINNAFDNCSYYGLKDLEYTFGHLHDCCKPILTKESFDSNYQMYTRRGDKERNMSIKEYLEKIKPYLIALIDEKKTTSHKIQLDIAINLVHLSKSDRITFYVKSKNIVCLPSDDSEDILNQLIESLLEYFEDKLMICRTDSSYVFESIERFSIHFHKIDFRRLIPIPYWIDVKKAVVNPKNKNDNFCFVYATTIAIYHKEIGKNPDRISSKLLEHAYKLDWNGIDFPASTPDYKRFEKFNEDIALNILYVPFADEDEREFDDVSIDIRPEYISKFSYTRKIQVVLLKISDGDKWHFLALKSDKEENSDCMKPTKSFSKLMRDISSSSHGNYYCFGCFHSFRCKSTLEKHTQLCKDHDFCKIKLPENDKKIQEHKPGSKALRMNDIIYVDLECLLVNYDTCSNNKYCSTHTFRIFNKCC